MTMPSQVKIKVVEHKNFTNFIFYTDEAGAFQINTEFEKPMPLENAEKIKPVIMRKQTEQPAYHSAGQVVKV